VKHLKEKVKECHHVSNPN